MSLVGSKTENETIDSPEAPSIVGSPQTTTNTYNSSHRCTSSGSLGSTPQKLTSSGELPSMEDNFVIAGSQHSSSSQMTTRKRSSSLLRPQEAKTFSVQCEQELSPFTKPIEFRAFSPGISSQCSSPAEMLHKKLDRKHKERRISITENETLFTLTSNEDLKDFDVPLHDEEAAPKRAALE
ncbi:hypothetical protein PCE1_003816 [Barthelona sp. PCE]